MTVQPTPKTVKPPIHSGTQPSPQSQESLQNTQIDTNELSSRPYIITYQLPKSTGLIPSVLSQKSHRPRRYHRKGVTPSQQIKEGKSIIIPLQRKAPPNEFVIVHNPNDQLGKEGVDLATVDRFIILSDSLQPPGKENYDQMKDNYPLLQNITEWRNVLSVDYNQVVFNLFGHKFHSVKEGMHYLKMEPDTIQSWNRIGGGGAYTDPSYTHLSPKQVLSREILEPPFWSRSLSDLQQLYPQWFEEICRRVGIVSGNLLQNQGEISYSNFVLKRLYYASVQSKQVIQDVLLATKSAELVTVCQSNYCRLQSLTEIRCLLQEGVTPSYYNAEKEKSLSHYNELITGIRNGILKWIRERKEIPTVEQVNLSIKIIIGREISSESEQDQIQTLIPQILMQNFQEFKTQLGLSEELHTRHQGEISLLPQQYQSKMDPLLEESGNDIRKLFSQEGSYGKATDVGFSILNSYLQPHQLISYNVPANGDCLFYSIIDGLWYNNLLPMNLDSDSHYPIQQERKSLSPFGTPPFHLVYTNAVKMSRKEIAEKIEANRYQPYSSAGESVVTLEEAVIFELKSIVDSETFASYEDPFLEYVNLVKTSADQEDLSQEDDKRNGIWGSEIEIQAACALYNIDIRRFGIHGNGEFESEQGMYYRAVDIRSRLNRGKSYSSGLQGEITIVLANYGDAEIGISNHYISTRPVHSELHLLVSPDNSVKRVVTDSKVVLAIGRDWQSEEGTFLALPESDVKESTHNSADTSVYLFSKGDQVYYNGKRVGNVSTNSIGVEFN